MDVSPLDLSRILDESAARFADRVAVVAGDRSFTFAELHDRVARLAGGFVGLGLVPGDRVATVLPNDIDLVTILFAAARAELICAPLIPRFAPPQLAYGLKHSGARALVTTPAILPNVPDEARDSLDAIVLQGDATIDPRAVSLDELLAAAPLAPVRTSPDPIGLVCYTSGTTSRPKGIALTQWRMARRVDMFLDEMGLTGDDSTILLADAGRPIVMLTQLLPMLRLGGRVHLVPGLDPARFWETYEAARPTYIISLPGVAFDLVDHPASEGRDHSALRFWVTGGDKAPAALHERLREVTGRQLLEMCGMTETGFYAINPPEGPVKVGSIGRPMRGVTLRLLQDGGLEAPPGELGRIFVKSPDGMVAYWNDTLQTHRLLRDGWLDTGDLARTDDDGYLWFVGRDKDMIVRGGRKVPPAMVEAALLQHPAVAGAAVVGASDARYGQVPFAFYQIHPGAADPGAEGLREWCAPRLDEPSIPAGFEKVEQWPVTGQGKLDRLRLARMAEGRARIPRAGGPDAARSPVGKN